MIHQTNEFIVLNYLIDPFFYSVRLLSYIFYLDLYLMSNEWIFFAPPTYFMKYKTSPTQG